MTYTRQLAEYKEAVMPLQHAPTPSIATPLIAANDLWQAAGGL